MYRYFTYLLFGCMAITCKAQVGNCSNPEFQFIFKGQGTNITIDCGTIQGSLITPAVWIVGGDTCSMITDTIWVTEQNCSNTNNMTEVNIRMDKTGETLDSSDFIITDIYCDAVLTITDTIPGDWEPLEGNSNVRIETYIVPCAYPSFMVIRITMGTDNSQEKLKILSGGTCLNCFTPALLDIQSIWLTANRHRQNTQLYLQYERKEEPVYITVEHATDNNVFSAVAHQEISVPDGYVLTLSDEPDEFRYYRVAMLMPDETVVYSPIATVSTTAEPHNLYPNPATRGATIFVHTDNKENADLFIYDVAGVLVHHTKTEGNTFVLPSTLPSGVYWIQTGSECRRQSSSLLVR